MIDYHLSIYRTACNQLYNDTLSERDWDRINVIRQASLMAIALEIGVIQEVGDATLTQAQSDQTLNFIDRYINQEIAA